MTVPDERAVAAATERHRPCRLIQSFGADRKPDRFAASPDSVGDGIG
jgi:hypothetical protein